MQNLILSPIEIPALVSLIAAEVEALLRHSPVYSPPPSPAQPYEPIRLNGDKAAAAYLGCSKLTVMNLRRSGAVPFYRYGKKVYFYSNELDQALKVQSRKFGRK